MNIDRIQTGLPNGAIFSIVQTDRRVEVAVLQNDKFVSITDWAGVNLDDDVLHISRTADDLAVYLVKAISWALNNMEVK